jgi:hypothetical protein
MVTTTLKTTERATQAEWPFLHSSMLGRDEEPIWYRKIDKPYYVWLRRAVSGMGGRVFDEDLTEATAAIDGIRDRAIELGILPTSIDNEALWPPSVSVAELFSQVDAIDYICEYGGPTSVELRSRSGNSTGVRYPAAGSSAGD